LIEFKEIPTYVKFDLAYGSAERNR